MNNTIDINTLSEEQLTAALAAKQQAKKEKEAAERKAYEEDNDAFIEVTFRKFQQLQNELRELKEYTIKEANKLYNRMYAINGKEPSDTKTFSRVNQSQTVKITVERQEKMKFTEEAQVHINTIKEIFKSKFESRNKGMYSILDGLLIKNSKGEYDPKLLAKARRQVRELGDEKLIEAFDKLDECQVVEGTSMYCRAYIKAEKGSWQDVSLNFSSL